MKTFKFEIILTEEDLEGDEFWEHALQQDGTGIQALTTVIEETIDESQLLAGSDKTGKDVVKLINFTL
jgi:hypothetical protein